MLGFRSLIALILSLFVHAGVATFFLTQEEAKEKPSPKKITLQVAMFKAEPPKKLPVVPPKVDVAPQVVKETIKQETQKKPEPKKKLAVQDKPKAKPKVTPKKIIKKPRPVKPKRVKPVKKKVVARKPRKITPPKKKAAVKKPQKVRQTRKTAPPVRVVTPPKRTTSPTKRVVKRAIKPKPVKRRAAQATRGNSQLEKQYSNGIRQLIERKKTYPRRAKRRKMQGMVKVAFSVNKSGMISKLRIHQSSGSKVLDKAALEAVKKVGKFPVIPTGIGKALLSYIIPIAYRLK